MHELFSLLDLAREAQERKDAEYSVANFRRQLASLKEKCTAIDGELEEYRAITANLERGRPFVLACALLISNTFRAREGKVHAASSCLKRAA